jgi:hypothetical protein
MIGFVLAKLQRPMDQKIEGLCFGTFPPSKLYPNSNTSRAKIVSDVFEFELISGTINLRI